MVDTNTKILNSNLHGLTLGNEIDYSPQFKEIDKQI